MVPSKSSSPSPLRWSNERPSEEGFYWYREREFDLNEIVRVYRAADSDELLAFGQLFEARKVQTMDGQWAGPISSPEEPAS